MVATGSPGSGVPPASGSLGPAEEDRRRGRDDYADVVESLRVLRAEQDDGRRVKLRDTIIERCLPLAEHIARRFGNRGENFDDLLQIARIGVVNAVDRFDTERGVGFLSFAVPTVMGEVRRHFRDTMWSVRVPRRAKETSLRIGKASDELIQRLGRSPRPSELAEYLDMPVGDVVDGLMARSAFRTRSIDAESDEQDGASIRDTLGGEDAALLRAEDILALRPAMETLTERERVILSLRFFQAMSQSEIAAQLGISQMHVSRLLSRTLTKLREQLASGV